MSEKSKLQKNNPADLIHFEPTEQSELKPSGLDSQRIPLNASEQVLEAILAGKYSWACVLILRFAGYNPLHYIPHKTYNRLSKENKTRKFGRKVDQVVNPKTNHTLSLNTSEQVLEAIVAGKYSWACVLMLRLAGYNPLHYIPYRTYNRLSKENNKASQNKKTSLRNSTTDLSYLETVSAENRISSKISDLSYPKAKEQDKKNSPSLEEQNKEKLIKYASDLDEADAQIGKLQIKIKQLQDETRRGLSKLAKVVDEL